MINFDRGLDQERRSCSSGLNGKIRAAHQAADAAAAARSRVALGLTAAAAWDASSSSNAAMRHGPVSAREACRAAFRRRCSGKNSERGELLARTVLHHSNDLFFASGFLASWLVKLDCGPTVVAHLHES